MPNPQSMYLLNRNAFRHLLRERLDHSMKDYHILPKS